MALELLEQLGMRAVKLTVDREAVATSYRLVDAGDSGDNAIHKLSEPGEDDDAYGAATKIGDLSRFAIEDMMRKSEVDEPPSGVRPVAHQIPHTDLAATIAVARFVLPEDAVEIISLPSPTTPPIAAEIISMPAVSTPPAAPSMNVVLPPSLTLTDTPPRRRVGRRIAIGVVVASSVVTAVLGVWALIG